MHVEHSALGLGGGGDDFGIGTRLGTNGRRERGAQRKRKDDRSEAERNAAHRQNGIWW